MDDIMIEIPSVRSKGDQLQAISNKISQIANNLVLIKGQLGPVWQDEGFSEYSADLDALVSRLQTLKETAAKMASICNQACEEYQAADNQVLSLF